MKSTKLYFFLLLIISIVDLYGQQPAMYYGDTYVANRPFAKDPYVIYFKNQYWMYYTVPDAQKKVLHIGIATSSDLTNWEKVGNIFGQPETIEANGICAPSALIKDGVLHLFYQSYGNAKLDAICHAQSTNGLDFERDASNPIFRPKAGDWSCGRAIDAEVVLFKDQYFLYYATRDTSYKIQQQGVAIAPRTTNFSRNDWKEVPNMPMLKPELDWEKKCIEAASCIQKGNYLYMFYAGAYNNEPQQIGLARSKDGIHWTRVSKEPFLKNGAKGSWNESESGHPHVFKAQDGRHYLFFQGNNDKGKTWYLSKVAIEWGKKGWTLKKKTNKSVSSKLGTATFVDAQSARNTKPFWVSDSLVNAKKNWQLVFSDEFNDSQVDTAKWTVENSIKKRSDVTLYSNNEQVQERDGKAFIYYRKSNLHDSAYFAGRFNSKGKFATTYGYLECRMHLIKPDGCQTAFWMMPNGEGNTAPKGVKDGTANDGAEIDIVEGNKLADAYSSGLHWDGYEKPAHKSNGTMIKAPNLHTQEYHVFGFEWAPTHLKFYYDGNLVRTIDKPFLIPHTPHFIYFSGSCFGESNWVDGDVRKNEAIQKGQADKAYIDYVRVYKNKSKP